MYTLSNVCILTTFIFRTARCLALETDETRLKRIVLEDHSSAAFIWRTCVGSSLSGKYYPPGGDISPRGATSLFLMQTKKKEYIEYCLKDEYSWRGDHQLLNSSTFDYTSPWFPPSHEPPIFHPGPSGSSYFYFLPFTRSLAPGCNIISSTSFPI